MVVKVEHRESSLFSTFHTYFALRVGSITSHPITPPSEFPPWPSPVFSVLLPLSFPLSPFFLFSRVLLQRPPCCTTNVSSSFPSEGLFVCSFAWSTVLRQSHLTPYVFFFQFTAQIWLFRGPSLMPLYTTITSVHTHKHVPTHFCLVCL